MLHQSRVCLPSLSLHLRGIWWPSATLPACRGQVSECCESLSSSLGPQKKHYYSSKIFLQTSKRMISCWYTIAFWGPEGALFGKRSLIPCHQHKQGYPKPSWLLAPAQAPLCDIEHFQFSRLTLFAFYCPGMTYIPADGCPHSQCARLGTACPLNWAWGTAGTTSTSWGHTTFLALHFWIFIFESSFLKMLCCSLLTWVLICLREVELAKTDRVEGPSGKIPSREMMHCCFTNPPSAGYHINLGCLTEVFSSYLGVIFIRVNPGLLWMWISPCSIWRTKQKF